MSTTLLQDLIGKIKTEHNDLYEAAKAGQTPTSAWDGPPLPQNLEYRVTVDSAEYKASKSSGRNQFVLTYEVNEPAEFAGRKVQDYYSPTPTNTIASEQLAKLFGALKANLEGWGEDLEGFVKQFEGKSLVIAVRTWGEDADRTGVRWVNPDYGQTLKTDIKPPKAKADTSKLTADIEIPKPQTPAEPATVAAPIAQPNQTTAPLPTSGGPNLPPGLRG